MLQALEVDAYASVHDMIHAAINQHAPQATLREVRWAGIMLDTHVSQSASAPAGNPLRHQPLKAYPRQDRVLYMRHNSLKAYVWDPILSLSCDALADIPRV